jgi:NTE family protein
MLKALGDAGITPDLVLGTSIGAFNGSVIADDPGPAGVTRLVGFWEEVAGADLFRGGLVDRVRNVATLKPAIHETSEIREILEHVHGPD